jgi:hypothetical protein
MAESAGTDEQAYAQKAAAMTVGEMDRRKRDH